MKVLFLDIDGVLNSDASRYAAHVRKAGDWATHRAWIEGAVNQLKRIIHDTGCFIVISSDWRLPHNVESLTDGFKAFQLPNWIGITPVFGSNNGSNGNRGREIAAWIASQEQNGISVISFAIVDDNPWMLPVQELNFVQTSETHGMTESDADRIIEILNKGS